jgi:hypothetical protein
MFTLMQEWNGFTLALFPLSSGGLSFSHVPLSSRALLLARYDTQRLFFADQCLG